MLDLPEPFGAVARGLILTATAALWTVLLVRLVGLRSFSKMTSFDFVTTIATGPLIAQAGTCSDWPSFLQAMSATRVSRSSILQKLRAANVLDFSQVRAGYWKPPETYRLSIGSDFDRRLVEGVDPI